MEKEPADQRNAPPEAPAELPEKHLQTDRSRRNLLRRPKAVLALFKETVAEWSDDKAPRMGAALAYYAIFSMAPMLIIVIAIVGLAFGERAAQGAIVGEIQGLVGKDSAAVIQTMIQSAHKPVTATLAGIIGIVTLMLGATGAFGEIQDALNTIWRIKPSSKGGLWRYIKARLLTFGLVLVVGFLLLVSLVLTAGLTAMVKHWGSLLPIPAVALEGLDVVVSLAVISILFGMMFKILPEAEIAWNDVWVGAALTAILFLGGKFLIGLYIGRSITQSAYGAAGSLVVLVAWVYYSAQIFYFGAEFTQVYANRHGSRVRPKPGARIVPKPRDEVQV